MTDACGFTEQEWEKVWESETATSTVHKSSFEDETYCEECDSEVVYTSGAVHGVCGCDSAV